MNGKNLAAIDLGTNSFHLIIVKIKNNGGFEIIDREKEVIRLGEGSAGDIKLILPDAIERALSCLKRFKGIAEAHNAKIRAVATSAVREAHNKNDFIQKVYNETGINVEVVSGFEEARLIYLGVLKALPIYNKKALIIDIGGGSTEFLIGKKGNPIYSVSLKIGAVRLSQKFFPDYIITKSRLEECRRWVEGEIFPIVEHIKKEGFEISVGSSGTIMSTGQMINAIKKGTTNSITPLNNFVFNKKELEKISEEILKRKTPGDRKKIPAMDEKRADIIPAGIIILQTIFDLLDINEMTISNYALREGIVIDTLQKHASEINKPVLSDIRKESIFHLAEKCNYDKKHSEHVAKLSLQIYDDLINLHKLDTEYRELLEAAAILHDVGYNISYANHHHHSYYLIKNSELLGFNENEIDIIAHTARYHRKSHPKPSHSEFEELSDKTKQVIKKLSSILRIADSLDRTHKQIIKSIKSELKGNSVIIKIEHDKNIMPDIELWNLERRKGLFEEVFKKKIKVEL
ncbi:Ppx/GppA phosphatase family protein [Rosettibacter firmus]|uniref:Ppx/GppA phosphatase family protein n=1 Tax=Rosettibacter firmus TaxID=3111522 RepID=UPI00336BE4A1